MIDKIKNYIIQHKSQILVILGALVTFITALESFGGKAAVACTVIVSILELIVYFLKNGLTDTFVTMLVNLVKLITQIVNSNNADTSKTIGASKELTDDEIKAFLLEGVK